MTESLKTCLARENLERMWWLLVGSTCLSIFMAVYNGFAVGETRVYPWSVFDIGGSAVFLGIFWLARHGRIRGAAVWGLGPAYFAFWLVLMLGYYTTGLEVVGETATFILGAVTPAVLIVLPPSVVGGLLGAYYLAFCMILFGPGAEDAKVEEVGASFLNGSLGVLVAFLAAWFLYRARRVNFENETAIREQAERARTGETRLRAILENVPFHAWLKGADGRFLAVNRSLARVLGREPEEIVSRTVAEVLDPELAKEFQDQDALVLKTGKQFRMEKEVKKEDGASRWLEILKYPIFGEDGTVEGIAGLAMDVTDRRMLADSLIATDRAKSEFLAMMSHEIRTPMHSILGYAGLLRDELHEPKAVEYLQCIQENGTLLLAIINDILDLSKIEANQLTLDPVPFNVRELVDRIRRRFSSAAEAKGIFLRAEVAPETAPVVIADERRLEQVLGNLVSNAIKFTAEGGVTLSITPHVDEEGRRLLRCVVRDTGMGISAADLARLFKPFTQIDNSMARRFGGSGLGLVIARNLCVRMGRVAREKPDRRGLDLLGHGAGRGS